jgi:catechol 2,3-dioxygenase-like lactoylglutathione lyase family enzyme
MRLQRLSYITLWAVKFDETRTFYGEILGLSVLEENQNFIMFDTKSSRLAFHRLAKGSRLDRPTVELHLEVSDVDEVYNSLQRRGIRFDDKPANMSWGNRMASLRDPEGYQVEIIGPLRKDESTEK